MPILNNRKSDNVEIYVTGWGDAFPECEYTNEDLCRIFHLPLEKAEKYERICGVKKRFMCIDHWNGGKQIIRDDQMATEAAKKAMKIADTNYKEIDTIISTASSIDLIMPGVAARVQSGLKIVECHLYNLIGGCTEIMNGIILASFLLEQGRAKTVLVTASEVNNAFYKDFRYPLQWFMDGDAGAAMILTTEKKGPYRLADHAYINVGRMENMFSVPIWGVKEPCPVVVHDEGIDPNMIGLADCDVKYRWYRKRFTNDSDSHKIMGINASTRAVKEILQNKEDTFYILPQSAYDIIESIAEALGVGMEQVATDFVNYGYTANATQIVSFCESFEKMNNYKDVIFASVGAGAVFGSALFQKV